MSPCAILAFLCGKSGKLCKKKKLTLLGDMTRVKFMGFDEKGRANFSRRDALKEMAENQ